MKVTKDIRMNPKYGDITISNGNINLNVNEKSIKEDAIIERTKTNYNDFILDTLYGANLERYFGKGIDKNLAESICSTIKYTLTYDGLINISELTISYIIINNEIHIRIEVLVSNQNLIIDATYQQGSLTID